MKKTCRGWASGGFSLGHRDVDVAVRGVCTCSWHKTCMEWKRCRSLFADGGEFGAERVLEGLMRDAGRKMPRSWKDGLGWKNRRWTTYDAKRKAKEKFSKLGFERCRPVKVTVETVKG